MVLSIATKTEEILMKAYNIIAAGTADLTKFFPGIRLRIPTTGTVANETITSVVMNVESLIETNKSNKIHRRWNK